MRFVLVRAFLVALASALVAGIAAVVAVRADGCAGPACAGLFVIPIGAALVGFVAGLVLGFVYFGLVRPRPMPKSWRAIENGPGRDEPS